MLRTEEGFSTPIALTVIFSLFVLTISVTMLVFSSEHIIASYNKKTNTKKDIQKILRDIEKEIQQLDSVQ